MARFLCGGLTTFDLAYFVDELPERGRKGTAAVSYVDVGGPVANAAVTAVLLGSEAEVHSVFGGGPFAIQVRALLHRPNPTAGVLQAGGGDLETALEAFAAPMDWWRLERGFVDAILENTLTPSSWQDVGPLPTGFEFLSLNFAGSSNLYTCLG